MNEQNPLYDQSVWPSTATWFDVLFGHRYYEFTNSEWVKYFAWHPVKIYYWHKQQIHPSDPQEYHIRKYKWCWMCNVYRRVAYYTIPAFTDSKFKRQVEFTTFDQIFLYGNTQWRVSLP